jgi:cyclopropane fatty-acyl-phospholipid synthase-like methyltransferase
MRRQFLVELAFSMHSVSLSIQKIRENNVTDKTALFDQCRKPTGRMGRFTLWRMNWSHSRLTDWGLAKISIGPHSTILDVGCGGGRTVSKLAAIATQGQVCGIDYSDESVGRDMTHVPPS